MKLLIDQLWRCRVNHYLCVHKNTRISIANTQVHYGDIVYFCYCCCCTCQEYLVASERYMGGPKVIDDSPGSYGIDAPVLCDRVKREAARIPGAAYLSFVPKCVMFLCCPHRLVDVVGRRPWHVRPVEPHTRKPMFSWFAPESRRDFLWSLTHYLLMLIASAFIRLINVSHQREHGSIGLMNGFLCSTRLNPCVVIDSRADSMRLSEAAAVQVTYVLWLLWSSNVFYCSNLLSW